MAALTTQILIGSPHPNDGGIIPSHFLFLSEGSRPAWILVNQNIDQTEKHKHSKITWIPTLENIFEDALLMIAVHICKNKEILNKAKDFNANIQADWMEMYTDLNESQRLQLYQECRTIENYSKIIVSTFRGSAIEGQLSILEQYKMDVEVCQVNYSRLYSSWRDNTTIEGSLK